MKKEEGENALVEKGPQTECGTVFLTHATVRFIEESVVTSATCVKRVLTWAMSKWTKDVVTFSEEQDEDTLVAKDIRLDAALCFSGTHANVRFTRETFVDKRLPREACLDLGDGQVERETL